MDVFVHIIGVKLAPVDENVRCDEYRNDIVLDFEASSGRVNLLDVFVADISEVISLRVTAQVIVKLVEEHAGDQLRVLRQR